MSVFRDLLQWDRFITPSIIRIFYALAVFMAVMGGVASLVGAIGTARLSLVGGLVMAVVSIVGTMMAILLLRIISEYVLIMFRINDHLGALRARAEG